jgi:hypothetical protein
VVDPLQVIIKEHFDGKKVPLLELEPDMQLLYSNRDIFDILREGNLGTCVDLASLVHDIGIDIIITIYCSPCYEFKLDKIKIEFMALGFDNLTSLRLFSMLDKSRRLLMHTKYNTMKTPPSGSPHSTITASTTSSR